MENVWNPTSTPTYRLDVVVLEYGSEIIQRNGSLICKITDLYLLASVHKLKNLAESRCAKFFPEYLVYEMDGKPRNRDTWLACTSHQREQVRTRTNPYMR
jgi:hypothetical protein